MHLRDKAELPKKPDIYSQLDQAHEQNNACVKGDGGSWPHRQPKCPAAVDGCQSDWRI